MESEQYINKPAIIRLARRADVKMISNSAYPVINKILYRDLYEIIELLLISNGNKVISYNDLITAFELLGKNASFSQGMIKKKNVKKTRN
jgi:histone H3/H4